MSTSPFPTFPNYLIDGILGRGSFSVVYSGRHCASNTPVALKVLTPGKLEAKHLQDEIEIMQTISHPFIVSIYEVFNYEGSTVFVMENLGGRSLYTTLVSSGPLDPPTAKKVFCQVVSALNYLHNEVSVVHRDLKLENIMLDEHGNARLIDFGLSTFFESDQLLSSAVGSPSYLSPEIYKGQKYSTASDVWSLGIVLYAIVTGKLPFDDRNMQNIRQKVICVEPYYAPSLPRDLVDLLKRMLFKDPLLRISISRITTHNYYSSFERLHLLNALSSMHDGSSSCMDERIKWRQQCNNAINDFAVRPTHGPTTPDSRLSLKESNVLKVVHQMRQRRTFSHTITRIAVSGKDSSPQNKTTLTRSAPPKRTAPLCTMNLLLSLRPSVNCY